MGRRSTRPGAYRKRASPTPDRNGEGPKRTREREPSTDYSKEPARDPYDDPGPNPLIAAGLALAFSGLGQIYNGRLVRAVLSVALPAILLAVAAATGSFTMYLLAFGSGVLTAPTVVLLLAAAAGWVDLSHPAVWMGLPIKIAMVGEAAVDAYQTRRQHRERRKRRWVGILYACCTGALVLIWMFSTGTATIRQPGMNPVLEPGDQVVVDRLAFGLQLPLVGVRLGGSPIRRGDRVAVLDPDGSGRLLIRRVFAVAGDRIDFGPRAGPYGIRQPMLSYGSAVAVPVPWLPWHGPCVYALEVKQRKRQANYARCQAYVELQAGHAYRVSYPRRSAAPPKKAYRTGKVGKGQVYLLADNRGVVRDSRHWGPVSARRIRGKPSTVLWSQDPLEGIRWHRLGLVPADHP